MLFRLDTNYHFPLFVCMLKGSRSSKYIISFSLNINWTRELRTLHSTTAPQSLVQVLRLGLWLFVVNSFTLSWLPDRMERGRVAQTSNNELTATPPPRHGQVHRNLYASAWYLHPNAYHTTDGSLLIKCSVSYPISINANNPVVVIRYS